MLTDDVEAMRDMVTNDHILIYKGAFSLRTVVVDIVIERLPEEIETVKMMEAFNVGGEATTVLGVYLYLVGFETRSWSFIDGNCKTSVLGNVSLMLVLNNTGELTIDT